MTAVTASVTRRRQPAARAPARDPRPVRLQLLGGFTVTRDGVPITVPLSQSRLLALLGLRRVRSRVQIAGLLWPDMSDARALGCLRTALWRLGQRLSPPGTDGDVLELDGDRVGLTPGVRVDVDELAAMARALEDGGPAGAGEALLRMAQEDLLPGWYDDWVLLEREHLREMRLHALEDLGRAYLREERFGPALRAAIGAEWVEPLRESPHRLLIEIHLAEGNRCDALRVYHAYRDLLGRELGVAPSVRMRDLLRVRDPAAAREAAG